MRIVATAALAALAAGCTSQTAEAPGPASYPVLGSADKCAALAAPEQTSAKWVAEANGLPGFCEVTGTLHPVAGSSIGVTYRLPASWNGKVLGIGGGGWQGNLTIQAASEGLRKGYATLQTNAGHAPGNVWDTSWASNPEALKDFSYRAIHEMTAAGKQLVASYYAQPHRKAYFQGCSTGGRMALMEAQRYPDDYDAISAGAPVYSLQVQTSAIFRNQAFARDNAGFSAADLQLAQSAAVKACDAQDGLEDGLINDPRQCHWNPAELQCGGAKADGCLSTTQVAALPRCLRAQCGRSHWSRRGLAPGRFRRATTAACRRARRTAGAWDRRPRTSRRRSCRAAPGNRPSRSERDRLGGPAPA